MPTRRRMGSARDTCNRKHGKWGQAHQRARMTDAVETAPDAAAFRKLYDTNFPLVWRALRRLGVPSSDMMDLTQKVFLVAYMKLPEFEGRSTLSTWLYAICFRTVSDHRRSPPRRNEITTDPASLPEGSDAETALTDVAMARQAEAQRILGKLSDEQRTVFLLYEVDELSGAEIASLLNVPLGTVRSRLRHARAIFKREVQRLGVQKRANGAR